MAARLSQTHLLYLIHLPHFPHLEAGAKPLILGLSQFSQSDNAVTCSLSKQGAANGTYYRHSDDQRGGLTCRVMGHSTPPLKNPPN